MRFVKNLIATVALATVVHQGGGVAGLPAGNPLGKLDESTVVTGTGTTASIPVRTSPGAIITTGSNMISDPASVFQTGTTPTAISVWEGSDGHMTLTGMPTARRGETETAVVSDTITVPHGPYSPLLRTHTVTESSSASVVPTGQVAVTPATIIEPHPGTSSGATVDARQATVDGPQATVDARQATVDGPQATVDARQATVDGPDATVDARQATVDGPQATVDARQATVDGPDATVDARQATVDGPQATVDSRQATVDGPQATVDSQDTQVTYLPKPPTGPGGSHPDADAPVEARQMLPITSSSIAISQRQMLPLPSSSSSVALSKRQMLPLPSSSSSAAISQRQMLPLPSSSSAISKRQMLPITSSSSAASKRQMLPLPSSSSSAAISARNGEAYPSGTPWGHAGQPNPNVKAHTPPGTPWGRQPNPNVKVGGTISTVTETSLHTVTATPSSTEEVTVTMTQTRPATSTSTTCTAEEPETTVTRTKTLSKDSLPEHTAPDVPIDSPITMTTTTCSHHSCATFTIISTVVVTPSSSTYTGGPWTPTPNIPTPNVDVVSTPPCIGSCSGTTASPPVSLPVAWTTYPLPSLSSTSTSATETSIWTDYPLPTLSSSSTSSTLSEEVTVITQTTHITTTFTPTGDEKIPPVTPPFNDPTFSVDPSDLPTMPPMKRDEQASITLTASYTITITEFPSETGTNEKVDPVPPHFGDPTFSVNPTDLPTMPPKKRAEKVDPVPPHFGDPTFSVDPTDLPTMPPKKRDEQASITLTASYTITITESPEFSIPPPTKRDEKIDPVPPHFGDPTFSVDPTDLPTMPPKKRAEKVNPVPPHFGDPTFSVDPTDLPTMPPKRDEQEAQVSITATAPYTITFSESIPIPTLDPAWSSMFPSNTRRAGDWVDPPVTAPEAGPLDPKAPFTDGPVNSHTYTHPTGRPHPTTLVTSVARSAA